MKKTILVMAVFLYVTGTTLTSCSSSAEKLDTARENLKEAKADVDQANKEYLADVEQFRKNAAATIAARNKSIADFKSRIETEKAEAREAYRKKITALEQKNSDLQKQMDDYKAESKDQWEKFKSDFSAQMDILGEEIKAYYHIPAN